jgi:peptidyl-prolyl cis-trans isomerase D
MLQKMRDNLQGWAAKVVLGLVIVTMALFGFGAFDFFSTADPAVATVAGRDITERELQMEVERQRQRIAAQLGPDAGPDAIDEARLRASVLDGLINRSVLLRAADEIGLAVSDAQLDQAIVSNPDFQIDGKFDRETFRALLAGAGHTPTSFRAELANSFRLVQLNGGITSSDFVTEAETRALARLLTQTRDVAYLVFDPASSSGQAEVTNEDVREHYDARPDEYTTPETVDVAYVSVSVADLAQSPEIVVTDEEIQSRYEADRDAFTGGVQRRTAHILLEVGPDRDEAAARTMLLEARSRIVAGEPFEAVAKAMSEDAGSAPAGGDLGFLSKDALVPEYAEAAWLLSEGEVSEPVTTQFGVHLIKLLETKTEQYPSLEERRDDIVASLRRGAAEEIYAERVRTLDERAFEVPESLEPIATEFGLAIQRQAGLERDRGTGVFANPKVREAAFSQDVLEGGANSGVVDDGNVAVVLRVENHHPAERKPLEAVAADIRAALLRERAATLARDAAARTLASVLAGDGTATIARTAGLEWKVVEKTRRTAPGVDPAVLRAAFELPRPNANARSAKSVDLAGDGVAVVMVSAVYDGDYSTLADTERAQLAQQWSNTVGNLEFAALFESVREDASVERR